MSIHRDDEVPEALYASLTDSVRRLVDLTIRSQADSRRIASAKALVDSAADELSGTVIPESFGVQHAADGSVWADVVLGAAYEGPPGHVHGGICALLLDHVLGATAHKPGQPAVTGTLTMRYELGTRLGPLRAEAHVDRVDGVKTFAVGHLTTPDGVTVRAEGVFIHPRTGR